MTEIKKKTWPKYFQEVLDGKKRFDIRLADFDLKEGDVLILEEYDPKTKKYTGRTIRKEVKFITRINPLDFHSAKQIKEFGFYGIGMQ
jgi:hypothetical protein